MGKAVSSARVDPSYLRVTFCVQWFDFLRVKPREINMQQRRRRRRHLKTELALIQTFSRLFHLVQIVKCFWSWILKAYRSLGTEKESRSLAFTFSTKRENRHFNVIVVQWRQRNVQKSAMHGQSCCFANLNLLGRLFKRSLTSVYQNRVLSHFQFVQRFCLNIICREQFH